MLIGIYTDGLAYGLIQGISIYAAVAFIVIITTVNDYMKDRQFQTLDAEVKDEDMAVIRGQHGTSSSFNVWDLVVGDIIIIEQGCKLPGDCILLDGMDITVDERIYTDKQDEPCIVAKQVAVPENYSYNPDPFLLSNTIVMSGSGTAVICAVGRMSRRGQAKFGEEECQDMHTCLQEKLERIAGQFGKFGFMSAIIIFAALILHKAIRVMAHDDEPLLGEPKPYYGQKSTLNKLLEYFAIAVTIVIVAVPEGLPMAVSISLAYSVDKMKKDSILVKNLESPEKMAGVEEICTGKTSTLTSGDMNVAAFYTEGKLVTVDRANALFTSQLSENSITLLKECILYNCDARVEMSNEATYEPEGNPTECGMLYFLQDNEILIHEEIQKKIGNILSIIPFNSNRKRQIVALRNPDDPTKVRIIAKGAPEMLI